MNIDGTPMTQLLQKAIKALSNLNDLPEEEQNAIASQIIKVLGLDESTVQNDYGNTIDSQPTGRTPGLGKGDIVIADNFDAPLPDSFWIGEE